ncbi:MAG: hypothetical protein K2X03_10560 [Bryobacteraceae bacterium]|nr:hypothetical protein [Bryobacteraceae bacterium]
MRPLSLCLCLLAGLANGQEKPPPVPETKPAETKAADNRRTELNLLGQADTASGESRRNENVQFNLIDNNAQKELNIRLGTTATFTPQFDPERNYFSSEYGTSPSASLHTPLAAVRRIRGQLYYRHLNSLTSARSFFQVGGVQPARENDYGFGVSLPLGTRTFLQLEGNQRRLRGVVNGNIQIPLATERTPLTTNPAETAFVSRILSAYPSANPNRTDIDPRMLNTNAGQSVDGDTAGIKLDRILTAKSRLTANYQFVRQQVLAFQFVRGQNPNTTTGAHRMRLTQSYAFSPTTTLDVSAGADRTHILIVPENNNLGPAIFISGGALTSINSNTILPVDRAQNDYRGGARLRLVRGRHTFTLGTDLLRRQLNGYDSDNHLGTFSFRANFGNDAITNLRLGKATTYFRSLGEIRRGFRSLEFTSYFGDTWRASTRLNLTASVRWRPLLRPAEVNRYTTIPYASDWNNLGPTLAFAYRLRHGVLRGGYAIHHGEIFQATYQQLRFNPPLNAKYIINDPDLLNPLNKLVPGVPRAVLYAVAPDLVAPYSQQYQLFWELPLSRTWTLQAGYLGSRARKLLVHWYENRARLEAGATTATINDRRPDSRYLDVRTVVNSARAYFDAGRLTLTSRNWRGLNLELSYWLSKNIDTGADFTSTAYDMDSFRGISQTQFNVNRDLRGLGRFDQPHAFLSRFTYAIPGRQRALRDWQFGSVILLKSGTPFTVVSGSDALPFGNADGSSGDRVDILAPGILGRTIGNPDTARQSLPRGAFAPTGIVPGNIGRNTFRRGGIYNVNASLERMFRMRSESELSFRVESVNALNTPQFAEPGTSWVDPNFGAITNTLNEGRTFRFQLGLRW